MHHKPHSDRHKQINKTREPPVNNEHDDKDSDHIGTVPNKIHHSPGDDLADQPGIRHDTRMNIPDRIPVKVRK